MAPKRKRSGLKPCPRGPSCPFKHEHQHTGEFSHDEPEKIPFPGSGKVLGGFTGAGQKLGGGDGGGGGGGAAAAAGFVGVGRKLGGGGAFGVPAPTPAPKPAEPRPPAPKPPAPKPQAPKPPAPVPPRVINLSPPKPKAKSKAPVIVDLTGDSP